MTPLTPADILFYIYNGKDCCCTYECNQELDKRLMPGQRKHYEFNVSLLPVLLYMELRGIRYDYEKAKAKLKRVQRWANVLQDIVNRAAAEKRDVIHGFYECLGKGFPGRDTRGVHAGDGEGVEEAVAEGKVSEAVREHVEHPDHPLIPLIASRLCLAKPRIREEVTTTRTFKNGKTKTTTKIVSRPADIRTFEDCKTFAKDSCKGAARRVCAILHQDSGSSRAARGELSVLLDVHVKVNSTSSKGDACWFLYEACGFPKQFQKEGNKLTDRLASDDEAVLNIWIKTKDKRALAFLKLRRLLTKMRALSAGHDADGRIRCGYNLVGSKTCRLSCYESPTGSGFNLQTTTEDDRDVFGGDEGCDFGQQDLRGADGWTVAARAASFGDRTMLEDLKFGLKPAQILALMVQEGLGVNQLSREALAVKCKTVKKSSWIYIACKKVLYGSAYLMGRNTMSSTIVTDSYKESGKPVYIEPGKCEWIQKNCFFVRYWGVRKWHQWMEWELQSNGKFITCGGHKRLFFGRKDDHKTLGDALSHEPQFNTTYAIKLALRRLWTDPENRRADGTLIVEPLHTVHDSLNHQWRREDREFALPKLREWFNNPLNIAGMELVLPFEGAYGRDWKHLDGGTI